MGITQPSGIHPMSGMRPTTRHAPNVRHAPNYLACNQCQAVLDMHPILGMDLVSGMHPLLDMHPMSGMHPLLDMHPMSGMHPLLDMHPMSGMHPWGVSPSRWGTCHSLGRISLLPGEYFPPSLVCIPSPPLPGGYFPLPGGYIHCGVAL